MINSFMHKMRDTSGNCYSLASPSIEASFCQSHLKISLFSRRRFIGKERKWYLMHYIFDALKFLSHCPDNLESEDESNNLKLTRSVWWYAACIKTQSPQENNGIYKDGH